MAEGIVAEEGLQGALAAMGPVRRLQVRAVEPGWALAAGLRAAAAAAERLGPAEWRLAGHVGEVLTTVDDDAAVADLVREVVGGLASAGVRAARLCPSPGARRTEAVRPVRAGIGPSNVLNGLAEAVASAYERAGEPVGARRAREAAAGADGDPALEESRRTRVLGLVLRTWLPHDLDAAGAGAEAAAIRALPNPSSDADAVLELVGRAVAASVGAVAAAPRPILDLEVAFAAGRDLVDVTWACAGVGGRSGEVLAREVSSGRTVERPGAVLYNAAVRAAVAGLFDEVADASDAALERWRRLTQDDRSAHRLAAAILAAPDADARFAALDQALAGVLADASPEAQEVLRREVGAVPTVAWALAICTGWEAAAERCRQVVARRGADGHPVATAREAATGAVLDHVRPQADAGAALLAQLARPG